MKRSLHGELDHLGSPAVEATPAAAPASPAVTMSVQAPQPTGCTKKWIF